MFPIWTIVLIIIIVITAIAIATYFIRRRRSRSLSVHTLHERDEEETKEKKSVSTGSFQTLVTQKQNAQLPLTPQLPASNELETPEPPQEIRISLPLPPPTTSFFSDKMELNSQDLFDMYLSPKKKKDESFLQQKTATLKSTLRQSLRLQQKNNRSSVMNMFTQKVASDSEPMIAFVKEPENMAKSSLDIQQTPLPEQQQPKINTVTTADYSIKIDDSTDESPITPNPHLQEPVRAAKRALRSASRKTKTRSVTNTEKPMNNDESNSSIEKIIYNENPINQPDQQTQEEDVKKGKHESIPFNSVRGLKGNGEHMTITSGSIRRFMRESNLNDEGEQLPAASTRKSLRKSGGVTTAEITSWWDDSKNERKEKASDINQPNHYRASLNASIFAGTLSRASGSSASLFADTNKEDTNGGIVSRHGSIRKGTLGRNTLKSITATATNGVNKSLKGLFDYTSANSSLNRIVPDDSQKMELDDEPPNSIAEEKLAIGQHGIYNSVRQKSVRTSNNSRPSLPTSYMPTSESSTKYALSDEEEADLSFKKTVVEDRRTEQHISSASSSYSNSQNKNLEASSPTSTTSPLSPITVISDHPSSSPSTSHPGDVDAIRRVLQDTWINNMKESGSSYSMLSDTDSVVSSTHQQSKLNPRQQNQSLLTKSLLSQQAAKRASLLKRQSIYEDEFIQGPEPSASFSSSTVRTMIPEQEPVAIRQNAINQKHGSNKIQEDLLSKSPVTESARNSSADSSRGHSRKSSGANSAATALRISSGYAANAKTWNGRKSANRPSVIPSSPSPQDMYASFSKNNNRAFFSTMRKGQKSRGNIPWMTDEAIEKTPAQMERDRYLEGKS